MRRRNYFTATAAAALMALALPVAGASAASRPEVATELCNAKGGVGANACMQPFQNKDVVGTVMVGVPSGDAGDWMFVRDVVGKVAAGKYKGKPIIKIEMNANLTHCAGLLSNGKVDVAFCSNGRGVEWIDLTGALLAIVNSDSAMTASTTTASVITATGPLKFPAQPSQQWCFTFGC